MTTRRGLITGLVSFVAAPAIVRVTSLMPIKVFDEDPITLVRFYQRYMIDWYRYDRYLPSDGYSGLTREPQHGADTLLQRVREIHRRSR